MLANEHLPVLPVETIQALAIQPGDLVLDCTFGRGGHSRLILEKLGTTGRLLAFDRDPDAIESDVAKELKQDSRFQIEKNTLARLEAKITQWGWHGKIAGILMDLGLSSPQLDRAERGFSFLKEGPLDMRMDVESGMTAAQWLETVSERRLAEVLKTFGEERNARKIARTIIEERGSRPIKTTLELSRLIRKAVPNPDPNKHHATRTFQAIRIFLNRELEELTAGLEQAVNVLRPGGRLAVISFHSLEDRIVKRFIREQSRGGSFPPGMPVQSAAYHPKLKALGRALRPDQQEISMNPRARSAILRSAERVA